MTIADFLTARIIEDGAALDCGVNSHDGITHADSPTSATCECDFRAKREWFAKQRILGFALGFRAKVTDQSDPLRRTMAEGMAAVAENAVQSLAAIYSDHPDYRPEWKP